MGVYTPVSRYFADRAAYEATGCAREDQAGAGGAATARSCPVTAGSRSVGARATRDGGAHVLVARRLRRSFVVDVLRVADGRRVGGIRRIRAARCSGSFSLPRSRPGAVDVVRLTMSLPGGRRDVRRVVLSTGADGQRRVLPPYYRRDDCALVRSAKLSSPVFGGTQRCGLGVAVKLNRFAELDVTVTRGGRGGPPPGVRAPAGWADPPAPPAGRPAARYLHGRGAGRRRDHARPAGPARPAPLSSHLASPRGKRHACRRRDPCRLWRGRSPSARPAHDRGRGPEAPQRQNGPATLAAEAVRARPQNPINAGRRGVTADGRGRGRFPRCSL